MLTAQAKRKLDIPHEPGSWMLLRVLPGKKLSEAKEKLQDYYQTKYIAKARGMGVDLFRAMTEGSSAAVIRNRAKEEAEAERKNGKEPAEKDPLDEYEVDTLLYSGILAWSYPEPVTPENIDDLDDQTRRWAALELIRPTTPPTDEERLERFLPSTPPSTE